MREFSQYSNERENIRELLARFENLKNGRPAAFIDEDGFENIIDYYEANEDYQQARHAVDIAIGQYPYSGSLLVKKADLLLYNKRYDQALQLLEQATIFDSSNIDIYILKTEVFLAQDRQEEAVELLQQALQRFNGNERLDLLFELADVYDDFEDFDKVFDCLKTILEEEPSNEEALFKICFWADFTGRNAESIELHQRIIDEHPYSELAWFNLGAAYQGLKLYERAIDAYKFAIAIDEKFDYAYRNMGDAYIRLRKYKDAIEHLEKLTELTKPEDVIYEALGYCYEKLKDYAQARFCYRKASHLNPDNGYMLYKIAFTYYREEKYEQCARQLEPAMRMKRNKPEYHLLMGQCKTAQGYTTDAVQYLMNVVRLRPKLVQGWEALFRCLYNAGAYETLLQQVELSESFIGEKPSLRYYRVAVYFALGKMKEALLLLEESLKSHPGQFKKLISLNPGLLNNNKVATLVARYKKRGKSSGR